MLAKHSINELGPLPQLVMLISSSAALYLFIPAVLAEYFFLIQLFDIVEKEFRQSIKMYVLK